MAARTTAASSHRALSAVLDVQGRTETLRRQLASALQVPEQAVELIELRRANLAMLATVHCTQQPSPRLRHAQFT